MVIQKKPYKLFVLESKRFFLIEGKEIYDLLCNRSDLVELLRFKRRLMAEGKSWINMNNSIKALYSVSFVILVLCAFLLIPLELARITKVWSSSENSFSQ